MQCIECEKSIVDGWGVEEVFTFIVLINAIEAIASAVKLMKKAYRNGKGSTCMAMKYQSNLVEQEAQEREREREKPNHHSKRIIDTVDDDKQDWQTESESKQYEWDGEHT